MTDQQPQGTDPAGSTPPAGTNPEGAASDSAASDSAASDSAGSSTSAGSVTMRRAPRYPRFIVLGAGLGAIVAYILTAAFPVDPLVGFAALFGYFALIGVSAGAAIGGLTAIVLDTVATRRAKTMGAERTVVDPTPEDVEGDLED